MSFEFDGELKPPDACHCAQCRKQSGHYFASSDVPRAALTVHGEDKVTWFASSEKVRRGFCSVCGSSLFWDPVQRDWTGIARTQNPYARSPFHDSSLFDDIRAALVRTWFIGWDRADAVITREKLR